MNLAYLSRFADHVWQSTLFALVAGLLALALRKNHAHVRHWVWLAASCKFLIPLSFLIALGSQVGWRTTQRTIPTDFSVVMDKVSQPFSVPAFSSPLPAAPLPTANPLPAVLVSIWVCGFVAITSAWLVHWRRIRVALRSGSPLQLEVPIRAMSCPTVLEPGVFGVFRPVLLLPERIFDRLTPAQLKAVIAHELCHIRRRDNLIAAIHMFIETFFWFHPVVWWIGRRMVAERERACDEEVLRLGTEPRLYAEGIINVCKSYLESPLACVSGVTGSDLKNRIHSILAGRVADDLSLVKKAALTVVGVVALIAPVAVGMVNASVIQAQSARPALSLATATQTPPAVRVRTLAEAAPVVPVQMAQVQASPVQTVTPKSPAAANPEFDVASVKQWVGDGCRGKLEFTPGGVAGCVTAKQIVQAAYRIKSYQISGGPDWLDSGGWLVEGKTATPVDGNQLRQMLATLLGRRFKLRFHRESRDMPVYALTVGKKGPRFRELKDTDAKAPYPANALIVLAETMQDFVDSLNGWADLRGNEIFASLDRPVIDKTGLQGTYLLVVNRRDQDADFKTMVEEDLGLRFESQKAPLAILVIDKIEKPDAN